MGTIWRVIGALVACLILRGVAMAVGGPATVPFKLYRGYAVVVRGSIGKLHNLKFILDTGSVPTVVDRRIARKLHLSGRSESLSLFNRSVEGERVPLPSLAVGPHKTGPVSVLVQDLSPIGESLGTRIDALVGLDALGSPTLCLDYESLELTFGEAGAPGATTRFEPGLPYVVVQLKVHGLPLRLLLDSGSNDLILFERSLADRLPGLEVREEKISSNLSGDVRLRRVRLPDAQLGKTNLGPLDAYVMNAPPNLARKLDGLLGTVSFGAKEIEVDFAHYLVAWK